MAGGMKSPGSVKAKGAAPATVGPLKVKSTATPTGYAHLWVILGALGVVDVVLMVLLLLK